MARQRVSQASIDLYKEEELRAQTAMEDYARAYLAGSLSVDVFHSRMKAELKSFYIRLALIAKGKQDLTELDRRDLSRFLAMIYNYLEGFISDLGSYNKALASDQGVISRAGSYGYGWGVFSRFTLPGEIADLLPHLPGLSCLGGERCGCWLEWEVNDDGVDVYWFLTIFKANCVICIDLATEWQPYHISREEIEEEFGEFDEF